MKMILDPVEKNVLFNCVQLFLEYTYTLSQEDLTYKKNLILLFGIYNSNSKISKRNKATPCIPLYVNRYIKCIYMYNKSFYLNK